MPPHCRRDRWSWAVARAKNLHPTTRLFLSTCLARHMKAGGFVSHGRHLLAAEFGITERRVSAHIQKAKETGWLVVVRPGVRTRTAEYEATFPDENRVTFPDTLSEPETDRIETEKGDGYKHPLWVTRTSPYSGRKGDENVTPLVVVTTTGSEPCDGDLRTCTCEECTEWRFVVIGRAASADPRDEMDGISNPSIHRNHLRAVTT